MAIIYTYPTVTPTVSDLIVLSDLSINGKPTKTCTIESVLDLNIKTAKVTLSSAQVQALNTTPVELIAAPGAGKALQVFSIMGFLDFNSVAYPTSLTMYVRYTGLTSDLHKAFHGSFLTASSDAYRGPIAPYLQTSSNSWLPNAGFEVYTQILSPGAGNSPITIWVLYKIIDI